MELKVISIHKECKTIGDLRPCLERKEGKWGKGRKRKEEKVRKKSQERETKRTN